MDAIDLAYWRMHNLGLSGEPFDSPEDVVRWLGAVQSQEFPHAKWSLAQRTRGCDDAGIERAFNEGRILRTHVLRPTWHFAHPDDIRLLLQVTGPRVQAKLRSRYRQLELDDPTLARCNDLMADALSGGAHLTRKELGGLLTGHGIDVAGQRLPHILMNAELEGLICSGPLNGKQHTYALLDERAPCRRSYDPDDALAEFTLRYFTSHGPATVKDLRAWSSLKIADIKRGIDLVNSELESLEFDGLTFWYVHGPPPDRHSAPDAHLLQGYDEYFMGYLESRYVVDVQRRLKTLHPDEMVANGSLVLASQLSGHWKRKVSANTVALEIYLHDQLGNAERAAIPHEVDRYGAFLDRDTSVEWRYV